MFEPELQTYTAWDLGISDYTSIVFFQAHEGKIRIVDYLESNGKSLEYYAKLLSEKNYRY